jgi:cytochrome c553
VPKLKLDCRQLSSARYARLAAGFDPLVGKPATKLIQKLQMYRSGAEGEGIMTRYALGYTDEQLRDIAQWLSRQR